MHAPYLINTLRRRISRADPVARDPARDLCCGGRHAQRVIVHGGHVADDNDTTSGLPALAQGVDRLETEVPVYLENTAGHAMARRFDTIARLWVVGDTGIGFCLRTPATWAAGEALTDAVDGSQLPHRSGAPQRLQDEAGSGQTATLTSAAARSLTCWWLPS